MRPNAAKFLAFAASLLCFSLICAPQLDAQTNTAQLSGFVTDSTGAAIPVASVLIVNRDTGVSRPAPTNKQGEYLAPALQPGHYRITVEAKGFQTLVTDNVTLNVGQDAILTFQLKVGAENQTVTVDGSGQIINTADGSVSTVVDRRFVENIPLNGRSFQDLISMTPGVSTQSPQTSQAAGASGDFSVNGQRTESNYYTVDGVSANVSAGAANGDPQAATSGSVGATTALGTTQSLISVDALQEFRVSSSTYSAEYGRSPGGQFSLLTRSGTKVFHGSAFDYLRNSYFDANNWFNDYFGTAPTALRQNDFGGTFGGPILPPRSIGSLYPSYFFFSYEGLRLTQPEAASAEYVPNISMRQAAPAVLKSVLNAFPLPTGVATDSSGLAPFALGYSLPGKINSTSGRLDSAVSPHLSLFFRFGDTSSSGESRMLSAVTTAAFDTQTYTSGATSQLSDRATNEFRLGYARSDSNTEAALDSFGGAMPIDLGSGLGNETAGTPSSAFELAFSGGTSVLEVSTNSNQTRQWNLVDNFSLGFGKHQLKFGVDYRRIKSPLYPPSPFVEGIYLSEAAVLSNSANIAILDRVLPATPIFNQTAAFVQDEWHISPGLSLSSGIRWEVNPPPTEAHGNDAFTLAGNLSDPASLTVAPRGTPLWRTSWYNFAPRLGAAWTVSKTPGWETVLRGGGGAFFDTGNQIATDGFEYLGFSAIQTKTNFAFPVTPQDLAFSPSITPPYTSTNVVAFPNHMQAPYTLQWNVSVQQAFHGDQSFTLSYVGANGRRLLQLQQISLGSLNPNFGTVDLVTTNTTSNYQALQAQLQRTVQHGLQVLASYTWSHSIDFGSTNAALPLIRGNSDFDVRSNLQGGLTWELPGTHSRPILKAMFSGWAADGRLMTRTAFPITLRGNLLTNAATGESYYGNVDLVPGQPIYLEGSQYPGRRIVNRGAFQLPTKGDAGNAPRNFVRGFGATQINLAARRSFPLTKTSTLQFRAEAFNILNHPIFGLVDSTLTDTTFGQATHTLNESLSTLAEQYQQGGPRSLQFALKIQF